MDGPPPPTVTPPTRSGPVWRAPLYGRLRGQPLPLVWTRDALVPAATLWAGARRWVDWLRAHGVTSGDRLVCALPPGPPFVAVLVAALWEELTFVPVPPVAQTDVPLDAEVEAALAAADARLAVVAPGPRARSAGRRPGLVVTDAAGGPPTRGPALRARRGEPTPAARFLVRTSGTTGAPQHVALSDANVRAVLQSHAPHLALSGATVLSVLPWHHAFGLVLELLPALLAGAELVRDPSGGRDPEATLAVAAEHPVTHLAAVPHTVRLLAASDAGRALLGRLRGGVVGGAPADDALAAVLRGTRVRAGYGQTEASPGIALGDPGVWRAGTLGRPVGCEVRLDADGVLAFRGPNAHYGRWTDAALVTLPADRWVRTGDLARAEPDGTYTFEGRAADNFKLDNGRFVSAAAVEGAVRARWPHVTEVLLSSPDGRALVLAVSIADGAALPAGDGLAEVLGPLATRPLRVVRVPPDGWTRTPKGELSRCVPVERAPNIDA